MHCVNLSCGGGDDDGKKSMLGGRWVAALLGVLQEESGLVQGTRVKFCLRFSSVMSFWAGSLLNEIHPKYGMSPECVFPHFPF